MTITTVSAVTGPDPARAGMRWGLAPDLPLQRRPGPRVVAVASSRGETVDRAFEDAGEFYLYAISPAAATFIGRQPCPRSGPGAVPAEAVRLLRDCDLVLCAGIGAHCRRLLDGLGVRCRLEYAGERLDQAVMSAGRDV